MIAPPRTAALLLASLGAEQHYRDAVIGDLVEEFAERAAADGAVAAKRWYYREALRAAPHLLRNWLRGVGREELARIGGILVTSATIALVAAILAAAFAVAVAANFGVSLTVSSLPWSNSLLAAGMMIGFLFAGASFWMFVGYVTAWVDARTPLVSATAFMAVLLLLSVAANVVGATSGSVHRIPLLFRLAVSTVNVFGMMAGAIIRVRRSDAAI